METKHTKGEWYAKDGQIYPIETGKTLALIPYFDKDNEEHNANQKLIAAAPKLLEALIELKSQFCGEKTPERLAAYKAELAIKSATE